ncbi:Cytoskeleton protein RodZ [Burkholderiales bacterium]|nr:Cytoskeleton protein RodZ [Burkholderiales bacterium]
MTGSDTPGAPEAKAATAGMILADTRRSAGMSIDDVAMQLKLAPRQVVAIERDDFASLPGRTFIRGFVRNYARLLKLDVDAVLLALPGEGADVALERPSLGATTRAIGELPSERSPRPGAARWAIPLVLVAIVAIAALYEFARPPSPAPSSAAANGAPPSAPGQAPAAPAEARPDAVPPSTGTQAPATGETPGLPSSVPAGLTSSTLPNPLATGAPAASDPPPAPAAASGTAPGTRDQLAIRFRGTSWIEVRDRSGNVMLSMTGSAGATREIALAVPAELTVGNVAAVEASWRGRPLDLTTQSRQNVARVRLD